MMFLMRLDSMYFGGYNCPDCLRYVKEGFGLFRLNKSGIYERYCWNCHNSQNIEIDEGEQNEKKKIEE